MADSKKDAELDKGFDEIPLDKGFEEVPLSNDQKSAVSKYISKPQVPMMESARAGLANGGTYGFAPRIGAAGGAAAEKLAGMPVGPEGFSLLPGHENTSKQSLSDLYNEYLKYNNDRQAKAQNAHPIIYGGAQLAGGIASPLNKIGAIGELAKDTPIISKMGLGAMAGARMGGLAGLSQSPDLTNPTEDMNAAGAGSAMGIGIGLGAPVAGATIKGLAGGAANILRPLIGKPGTMAGKGMQAGMEGGPNLAGEPGQLQAVQQRGQFAEQFVKDVHDVLSSNAKNKRELITNALAKSQLAPAEAVQVIQQKYLEANPQLNEESARKELAQLKEMFITAAEGPKKTETQRVYNPGAQPNVPGAAPQPEMPMPPPGSSAMPPQGPPPGPGGPPMIRPPAGPPVPQGAPAPQSPPPQASSSQGGPPPIQPAPPLQATAPGYNLPATQNNLPSAPSGEPITGQATPMGPTPADTPSDFSGYEAVHKATIDPADDEARAAFQQKIHEKLADEKALGQNSNDNPIQMEEHPIPGTDKVRLVAKRAIQDEDADAFKDQAAQVAQKQREDIRLQNMLDQQNELKMKMQAQHEAEMAKPQFQDMQVETREGGRNLQDPAELYQLQKNLQAKSQFAEGRGFSSQEMNKMSGDAAKDIAQLIKMTIPETVPVDERLNAFNNVAESLGIDTSKLQAPGGEGQKARQDAMKKVLSVLSPEAPTDKSQINNNSIDYIQGQLNRVHPDIGEAFGQEAAKHAENASTISDLTKPETVGGGGPILSSIRRGINKTAYNTGYGIGSEVKKMQPMINSAKQLFQQYTPQALQKAGAAASQSTNQAVQQMGQVLTKLASADDRTRNSMMFVLQQQAGYRELMAPYFQTEPEGTPQAKDKSLEKFK
jgi:hypothetical protein